MLQRSLILLHAARNYKTPAQRGGIAALPLDVILRRLQSCSPTSSSRGLAAHFGDIMVTEGGASAGPSSHHTSSNATSSSSYAIGDGDNNNNNNNSYYDENATQRIREEISNRFLAAMRSSDSFFQDAAVGVEYVSLILSNAVRHELAADVVHHSFVMLSDCMTGVRRPRQPRSIFGSSFAAAAAGEASQSLERCEALVRVMEACVAVADLHSQHAVLKENPKCFTSEEWATLVSWVEEYWDCFQSSPSTVSLLVQFLTTVSSCVALHRVEEPAAPRSVTESLSKSLISLGALQTDTKLLQERSYMLTNKAFEALSSNSCEMGSAAAYSVAELVRLCHATQRLQAYERQHHVASTTTPKRSATSWWPASTSPAPPPVSTASGGGGGPRLPAHAEAASAQRRLHRDMSAFICGQAMWCLGGGRRRAVTMPSSSSSPSVSAMADIFSTACDGAPLESSASLAVHLCELLKQQSRHVAASVEGMDSLLRIGEACVRQPEGTLTLLAEVLRVLQQSVSMILPLLTTSMRHRTLDDDLAPTLWPRACGLIELAPLPVRTLADQTLFVFVKQLQGLAARRTGLDSSSVASSNSTALTASVLPEFASLSSLRHGALLISSQLLARPRGYLSPMLEKYVRDLVVAAPFSCEELQPLVRAIHVCTQLAAAAGTRPQSSSSNPLVVPEVYLTTISQLLSVVAQILPLQKSADGGVRPFTAAERSSLRESLRRIISSIGPAPVRAADSIFPPLNTTTTTTQNTEHRRQGAYGHKQTHGRRPAAYTTVPSLSIPMPGSSSSRVSPSAVCPPTDMTSLKFKIQVAARDLTHHLAL